MKKPPAKKKQKSKKAARSGRKGSPPPHHLSFVVPSLPPAASVEPSLESVLKRAAAVFPAVHPIVDVKVPAVAVAAPEPPALEANPATVPPPSPGSPARPASLRSRLAEVGAVQDGPAQAVALAGAAAGQPAQVVGAEQTSNAPQRPAERVTEPVQPARASVNAETEPQRIPGEQAASAHGGQPESKQSDAKQKTGQEREAGGTDDGTKDAAGNVRPLLKRTSNREQREIIQQGMASAKRHLITVAIFSLAVNLLVLVLPIYLFQVSDRVLTSRSIDTLVMLTIVVIGAVGLQSLLDVFRRLLLMRVAVQVETTLGAAVLAAATKGAQQGSTRDFQALLDLQQLRNFITGPTLLQIFDAPVAPVYFVAVFLVHPHLGMVLVVASLVLVALALVNRRITALPYAQAGGFNSRASQHVEAMARNAQVINAMGMIREGTILWGRETAEALKAQISAQDRNVYMTGVTKFVRLSTQIAMLGWGAHLVLNNELTGGMMIAASIVASRALSPVEGLIEGWRSVLQARTGYARVQALLNSTPLNQERLQLPRPQGRLHVDRVLFVPPPTKKVILNGIDFTLDPGESLAIVGPSGTGKSTLARMLIGSITPTSGSVRLDLMDIRNWDPRQFGETIGYLAQDVELLPATVKANIARLREDVTDEEIFNAAELAGVHEMIASLPQGYETMIGLDGSPLSGGQKQRIGLARAFFGRPRLVVLDEPNSNLDSAGEAALAKALLKAKQFGITVVAITQRPALLKSVDKIMLLTEGKVQALGARDEILQRLSGQKRTLIESAA